LRSRALTLPSPPLFPLRGAVEREATEQLICEPVLSHSVQFRLTWSV